MKFWAREFKENHMLCDTTVEDTTEDTRTHKIFNALDKVCHEFDLSRPIWLDSNVKEFKKLSKTRFTTDSFIDQVPFDYLEFIVLEEDI